MRKGLTVSYRAEKLAKIQTTLDSDEHYENTPTTYYGEFDPIGETVNYINACNECGGEAETIFEIPSIEQVPGAQNNDTANLWKPRSLWFVECQECSANSRAVKKQWQAILDWNKSPKSETPSYKQLPLFGLQKLSKVDALIRLSAIRVDLELKINEAGLQGDLRKQTANTPSKDQMKAYLSWCIYAQGLVKQFKEEFTVND